MNKKIKSPSRKKREERDKKIICLYDRLKENFERATDLYDHIAAKVGCGYGTVILVLQKNGILTPKNKQQ